ncbi:MAG: type II secretion system protein [Patescibacteria group bacterium]|nr:type II secretion system protein [Patescibacteria group bacterium]
MDKKNTKQKGFTLVELLVVIAIIGLLSTLSIVALNSARTKARDAARTASIKQWQTALELYYSDRGGYPNGVEGSPANIYQTGTVGSSTPGWPLTKQDVTYLGKVPNNTVPWTGGPCTTGADFDYVPDPTWTGDKADTGTTYAITYCLEGGAGGIAAGWHTATPAGIQ